MNRTEQYVKYKKIEKKEVSLSIREVFNSFIKVILVVVPFAVWIGILCVALYDKYGKNTTEQVIYELKSVFSENKSCLKEGENKIEMFFSENLNTVKLIVNNNCLVNSTIKGEVNDYRIVNNLLSFKVILNNNNKVNFLSVYR